MTRTGLAPAAAVVGAACLGAALMAGGTGVPAGTAAGRSLPPGAVPPAYLDLVTTAGRTCPAAPPSILAAQLEAESGWNPDARSPAGAVGIAQFMPATWARWGRDGNRDGRSDPHDPRDAIPAQAAYDCALADEMGRALRLGTVDGGLTELMLAAYNAGPGAVLAAGGVPPILETRQYVARITARARSFSTFPAPSFSAMTGQGLTPDEFGVRVVAAAVSQTGVPYAWGGGTTAGPSRGSGSGADLVGFDCSGLVRFAVYQASDGRIVLPRSADAQSRAGTPVPLDRLRPGDVLSFTRPRESVAHHIGIYLGEGRMLNAPRSGGFVRVEVLDTAYWRSQGWRAVRYVV